VPRSTPIDRPLATVDVAIFAVLGAGLHVLLVKRPTDRDEPFPSVWALPGGYVDVAQDASLEACALRKLREKTGVRSPYLEQVGTWGGPRRDPRGWTLTCVYFALIASEGVAIAAGGNAEDARWHLVQAEGVAERLAFDHAALLAAAVRRLRNKVEYTSLPAFLLPKAFTLTELQATYETVLGRALDKSAFRTRMLAADAVEPTGEIRSGSNRPAQLYRLKDRTPVFFPRTFSPRAGND
jgi:8-oxo-dGTP diphosphatase